MINTVRRREGVLLCFYEMVMEGLSNGIVFMSKYHEKKEDHLWLEEWIKIIQFSVNSKHKRTKGIVAREEAREEEAGGHVRSGSLYHASSTSKNDCRE